MIDELFNLNGKISVVTGGSGALGQVMALGLAKFGSEIVIADIIPDRADQTIKQIDALKRKALTIQVDVTDTRDVKKMGDLVLDEFGRIDILVNAAGIAIRSTAENTQEEDWNKVISVNLTGTFLCSQAVGQVMIKQKGGKIINIASVVGQKGLFHPADLACSYCASKGGVIQLTRALSAEWAKFNIRVNAIAPTYFKTGMAEPLLSNKEFYNYLMVKIPLGRIGEPEELVGPLIFLASEASTMVTGHVLNVDGGWLAI